MRTKSFRNSYSNTIIKCLSVQVSEFLYSVFYFCYYFLCFFLVASDDGLLTAYPKGVQCLHVLQYSPPPNKAIFRLRLSLLYAAFLK